LFIDTLLEVSQEVLVQARSVSFFLFSFSHEKAQKAQKGLGARTQQKINLFQNFLDSSGSSAQTLLCFLCLFVAKRKQEKANWQS